ncbi:unnamed protein product [Prunus armeniaca]
MAGNNDDNQALEDYAQLVIPNSPSCILLPTEARNYDLKSSHFHMLPSFYCLPNEDPLAHIKEFYNVVSGLTLQGVSEASLRMRLFPYTLKDRAKGWLMTLAPGSLTTWGTVAKKFLDKFFSTQKTATLRGQIFNFKQDDGEPFNECWERFKGMLLQCPHHGRWSFEEKKMLKSHITFTRCWDLTLNTKIQEVASLEKKLDSVLNMVPKIAGCVPFATYQVIPFINAQLVRLILNSFKSK